MIRTMSLTTRRELLDSVRQRYENANRIDKGRVLDGFVAAIGYERKYAILILNNDETTTAPRKRHGSQKYDEQVKQALISLWCAADQICSKPLVPFLRKHTASETKNFLRISMIFKWAYLIFFGQIIVTN
jgi:hypothetical protein